MWSFTSSVNDGSYEKSGDDYDIIKIAYSQGARMFEKHIGLNIKQYKLNA